MNTTTRPRSTSRRTGRLGLRVAAASVAMASLIGAAAGSASADLPVQGNKATITQTGLERHGTWARLEWTSNASLTYVNISTSPPTQANGWWSATGNITTGSAHKLNGGFAYNAQGLNPNTSYHVVLTTVKEGNLNTSQAVGQFTTKKISRITATFDQVEVSNDGDGTGKGAGDLWWYFDTSFSPWKDGWHRSTSSGDSFAVPAERGEFGALYPSVGKSVTVTLQAAEDDIFGYGDWSCGGYFDTWSGEPRMESNHCVQYSFAQAEVDLPTFVWESQPRSFTASTPYTGRSPLWFNVTGTIQVDYA